MARGPKHDGVTLEKPNEARRTWWRAGFKDPDSGKYVKVTVPRSLKTTEQRAQWAAQKTRDIEWRKHELAKGAVHHTRTPLGEVIDKFLPAHPQHRDKTQAIYKSAAEDLKSWCEANNVKTTDELTRAKLFDFREHLIKRPKHTAAKGKGKRGKFKEAKKRRSAVSINQDFRSIRTILGYLCQRDSFSRLSVGDLQLALKKLPVTHEQPEFLKPAELSELLTAAQKHDTTTFKMTRHDKELGIKKSVTVKYETITPFVLFVLLTGMRFSEAAGITWRSIDLDAQDIHLRGSETKTKHARRVDLSVSPWLHSMLTKVHDKKPKDYQGRLFPHLSEDGKAEIKRLRSCKAPEGFTWQLLRSTCSTFLTNAPGIFGAASAYRSAKQLGHSVDVAEKHYAGLMKGIPAEAKSLEAAMAIEAVLTSILDAMPGLRLVA